MNLNDTQRTDAHFFGSKGDDNAYEFARELERELNEANARLDARLGRVATHSERCHLWHIDCAVARLESMTKDRDDWRKCARNLAEAYTSGDFQAMREFKELDGE